MPGRAPRRRATRRAKRRPRAPRRPRAVRRRTPRASVVRSARARGATGRPRRRPGGRRAPPAGPATALAKCLATLADRRRHRLGGVAGPLGADARRVQLGVGRVVARAPRRPGAACATASPRARRARGRGRRRRRRRARRGRPPTGGRAGRSTRSERIAASSSSRDVVAFGAEDVEQARSPASRSIGTERGDARFRAARAARRRRAPRRAGRRATSARSRSDSSHAGVERPDGTCAGRSAGGGVATRAWCTSSGSSPRRTPGSCASRRRGRPSDRRPQHLGGGGREVEPRSAARGRARRARGVRARATIFGDLLRARPRRRRAGGRRRARTSFGDAAVGELHLELAERRLSGHRRRAP